ncbi:MAG: alpha/beta fold hydrolase [Ideonella sp.]|nr:alpha/beta fold hydrolase [Ideonella sp.]MCC7456335.1 alpha/beta fold hydrolase [Nitrospira sp.]
MRTTPAVTSPCAALRGLHADPAPYRTHRLDVGGGHVLAVRESGTPSGIAAVVLHGGPGSGCTPLQRRFFDPARYRIVCIDQRGAGESRPRGAVAHNTPTELLHDLRRVRETLGIARWLVVGGSWGATLALLHALHEPTAVAALLLRAVFLARPQDMAAFFVPAAFSAAFGRRLDGASAQAVLDTLDERLQHGSAEQQRACALAWWRHEQAMASAALDDPHAQRLDPQAQLANTQAQPANTQAQPLDPRAQPADLDAQVDRYRVQAHYMRHGCWVQRPPLLARCAALAPRPMLILQGSADRICPPDGAQALQRVLPWAALEPVAGSGHDPSYPAMVDAMVRALDGYAEHGHFTPAAQPGP